MPQAPAGLAGSEQRQNNFGSASVSSSPAVRSLFLKQEPLNTCFLWMMCHKWHFVEQSYSSLAGFT